jgi:hypothetical protein
MCLHTVIAKVGDAGTNAMLLGIPNAIGTYNHENDYTTVEENRAYLQGRLMGDAAVLGTTVPRMLSALGTAAAGSETVVVGIASRLIGSSTCGSFRASGCAGCDYSCAEVVPVEYGGEC